MAHPLGEFPNMFSFPYCLPYRKMRTKDLKELQKQQSEQLISFFSMYKTTFPSAHLSAGSILNEKNSISNHKIQILSYQWD